MFPPMLVNIIYQQDSALEFYLSFYYLLTGFILWFPVRRHHIGITHTRWIFNCRFILDSPQCVWFIALYVYIHYPFLLPMLF